VLGLGFHLRPSPEDIAMDRTMEPEVDEQEGWAIVEIRKALSGTEINVSQYGDDNGFFF
jgi:hypothetical protein